MTWDFVKAVRSFLDLLLNFVVPLVFLGLNLAFDLAVGFTTAGADDELNEDDENMLEDDKLDEFVELSKLFRMHSFLLAFCCRFCLVLSCSAVVDFSRSFGVVAMLV